MRAAVFYRRTEEAVCVGRPLGRRPRQARDAMVVDCPVIRLEDGRRHRRCRLFAVVPRRVAQKPSSQRYSDT